MSDPVAHHPVEGALRVPGPPVDDAWTRLITAENTLQGQAQQMANLQASIDSMTKIVSLLTEKPKEEKVPRSPETEVRSHVRPSEPPDFDGT